VPCRKNAHVTQSNQTSECSYATALPCHSLRVIVAPSFFSYNTFPSSNQPTNPSACQTSSFISHTYLTRPIDAIKPPVDIKTTNLLHSLQNPERDQIKCLVVKVYAPHPLPSVERREGKRHINTFDGASTNASAF